MANLKTYPHHPTQSLTKKKGLQSTVFKVHNQWTMTGSLLFLSNLLSTKIPHSNRIVALGSFVDQPYAPSNLNQITFTSLISIVILDLNRISFLSISFQTSMQSSFNSFRHFCPWFPKGDFFFFMCFIPTCLSKLFYICLNKNCVYQPQLVAWHVQSHIVRGRSKEGLKAKK